MPPVFRSAHWFWIVVAAWPLVIGCSAKEARYPADFARYQRIDAAVETLRASYAKKDPKAFAGLMLPLEPLELMQAEVGKDFDTYQDISLDISIERIVIDGNTIEVYVHWSGQWKKSPAEDGVRERGHGMLRWVGVQSILLSSVEGDLPFGMASRQAGTASPEPPKAPTP